MYQKNIFTNQILQHMERENLYRAKRKLNGFWVYGSYTHIGNDWCQIVPPATEYDEIENRQYRVITETVGQSSTLSDSKNTRVFEGDIFLVMYFKEKGLAGAGFLPTKSIYGEVVFHNAMFCIRFKHPEVADPYTYVPLHEFLASGNRIIAGNIHDNANLIIQE